MTGLLGRFADYLDDYGEPEKAFLSGLRDGLKNNPTRALDEMQAIQKEAEAVKAAVGKTRKRLESRYDRDFPTLMK